MENIITVDYTDGKVEYVSTILGWCAIYEDGVYTEMSSNEYWDCLEGLVE